MHKYEKEPTLQEKILSMFKSQGLLQTLRFALIKIFLPVYKVFVTKKSFEYDGGKVFYFLHNYNNTWDNERGVEVAIFMKLLDDYLIKNASVLEIGHVLGHYKKNNGMWDVLDKFEKSPSVINEDIVDYDPKKRYDLIFSISTMEHVGFDDTVIETNKIDVAINNVKRLLSKKGIFVMSDPLGYNKSFDKKVLENRYGFTKRIFLKRYGYRDWRQVGLNDIQNCTYDSPFNAANGLVICYLTNK